MHLYSTWRERGVLPYRVHAGKKPPIGPKPQAAMGAAGAPQLEVVGQGHMATDPRSSSLMQLANSPRKASISDNGFGPLRPRSPKCVGPPALTGFHPASALSLFLIDSERC